MMENRRLTASLLILTGFFILFPALLGFAKEGNVFRTQGLINSGGDPRSGYLFINEMKVYIDKTTEVTDYRGMSIPVAELKPKRWVYMEVGKDPGQKTIRAKRIYLLPRYVSSREKQKFSFMK